MSYNQRDYSAESAIIYTKFNIDPTYVEGDKEYMIMCKAMSNEGLEFSIANNFSAYWTRITTEELTERILLGIEVPVPSC